MGQWVEKEMANIGKMMYKTIVNHSNQHEILELLDEIQFQSIQIPKSELLMAYYGIWFPDDSISYCCASLGMSPDHLCFFPADAAGQGNGQPTGHSLCWTSFLEKAGFVPNRVLTTTKGS